jgi:hypothetical protein
VNDIDESAQQWEQIRELAGIPREKWAVMNRADRRAAARATRRPPRDRMVQKPGRDR